MKQELVRKWMATDLIAIRSNTSLLEAQALLHENNIRRLPVVDEDNILIGIVTLGDIREASPSDATSLSVWELNYLLDKLKISEVMTPDPITVYTTHTIAEAAGIMLENKVSGLPVIEPGGKLVGIITESDIFRMVVQNWGQLKTEPEAEEIIEVT